MGCGVYQTPILYLKKENKKKMYNDFETQIQKILEDTEKTIKEGKQSTNKLMTVAMYKILVGAITKFVESESKNDSNFNNALSYNWKSAGRMLKYVFGNAKNIATNVGNNATACCVPSDVVFAWIKEYYFLDDKEQVEKELKAEAEKQKKAENEKKKEAELKSKAIDVLSRSADWNTLSDKEKEKKINDKIRNLKAAEKRKDNKKTDKSMSIQDTKTTSEFNNNQNVDKIEKDIIITSDNKEETKEYTNSSSENKPYFEMSPVEFELLDGQMTLFDL